MKTIPVLIGFDQAKVIGSMTIDETKLPPGMDYVFSLGACVEKVTRDGSAELKIEQAELVCVSLQTDDEYRRYLDSERARTTFVNININNDNLDKRIAEALRRNGDSRVGV